MTTAASGSSSSSNSPPSGQQQDIPLTFGLLEQMLTSPPLLGIPPAALEQAFANQQLLPNVQLQLLEALAKTGSLLVASQMNGSAIKPSGNLMREGAME
jgi:hypothetical protein